jgi:hypothetical protein
MEIQGMKQRIKDYFVEIKEDKFTKVKTIKCKHNIIWKGKELENKFIHTQNSYSNELKMGIDYRHKDEVDSVFFTFIYTNSDDGYPGMTNIKMYLILDDNKNIELSESSGFDHTNQSSKVGDNYISIYLETAQLAVSMSDFIAIVNAKKIEYSIRFGQGSLEKSIDQNQMIIFKGFYNASFDNEFETETIFDSIKGKFVDNELLSNFKRFIDSSGYTCVKTDIDIEHFRFTPNQKSAIILDENETVILTIYSNSFDKTLCDMLITNKRMYYFVALGAKVKSIDLNGNLDFEVGKNFFGIEKLMEKSTSFSMMFNIGGIVYEVSKVLNSIVESNNGK